MKVVTAAMALILTANVAYADMMQRYVDSRRDAFAEAMKKYETMPDDTPPSDEDKCLGISMLVATIAMAHQNGVPAASLVQIANNSDSDMAVAMKAMVMAVVNTTRWNGEEAKLRAVQDAENQAYTGCME